MGFFIKIIIKVLGLKLTKIVTKRLVRWCLGNIVTGPKFEVALYIGLKPRDCS